MHIIVCGSVKDGFTFTGPFDDFDLADDYAASAFKNYSYEIVELEEPDA